MVNATSVGTLGGAGIGAALGGVPGAKIGASLGGFFGSLFGGSKKRPKAINISTPSFFAQPGERGTLLKRTQTPFAALGSQQKGLFNSLTDIARRIGPGIGDLTKAGVTSLRRSRDERLGNLRAQLSKRGVLGSSFGEAQQASERLAADEVEAEFRAKTIFEEISLLTANIKERSTLLQQSITNSLNELRIAGSLSASFINSVQSSAELEQALAIANAEGIGAFGESIANDLGGFDIGTIFNPDAPNPNTRAGNFVNLRRATPITGVR